MKKLRVGIAGYGVVGKRRHLYVDRNPSLEVVAVCDQNFKDGDLLDGGVRCFSKYSRLLEEKLDVLLVSLPNYLAPEVTMAGLERGLHVFCEKPPGRTVGDVRRVIEVHKKHPKLVLKYGFNHRYHESVKAALKIIQSGELGSIVNMRGVYGKSKIIPFGGGWRAEHRYAGGGILLDQGIHMVDLMLLFCGEFSKIHSIVSNKFWKHDVEDNAYVLMEDKLGRVAMLHSSATQWQHTFSLDIALEAGYLELSGILSGSKSYGEERLHIGRRDEADIGSTREEVITYLNDNSWGDEIDEFADAIVKGTPIKSGSEDDALATMKLVHRIYCADVEWKKRYNLTSEDD
jgi:predicted dehydrogenase